MELRTKLLIITGCLSILFLASTIVALVGKGIHINESIQNTVHQHQHQEQFQGQLLLQFWQAQGDMVEWQFAEISKNISLKEMKQKITDILMPLPPYVAYFSQVILCEDGILIMYPNFIKKK